ncbi:hypothetical protein GYMLUDRAFT_43553 [Collybiopsis luxurians FD-317 M1]|uniref:Uncharacterized protein n=1 Tax=Collybiopsis luxurians FD-317 M1 TaxID=944289 RepID=A0A0D0CPC7_9AGAR|nr:hypothetical protein GYMLUDRAFT_43553 [Collybiopsis luxurians FD-317 M1]
MSRGTLPHQPPSASAAIGARQISRDTSDKENYLYTQRFLEHYAGSGNGLARLGARCLELNQTLRFCEPTTPWIIDTKYLQFDSIVTLPIDAAIKAHFCLETCLSPTPRKLRYEQMYFVVEFDENELRRVLTNVVELLESLRDTTLSSSINVTAEELADALENAIVVKLTEFTINERAVEMFCHSLRNRGQAFPRELRHI